MRVGGSKSSGCFRQGASASALTASLLASSACTLDFDVGDREFACPPEVTGCLACNPDGSCRTQAETIRTPLSPQPLPAGPPRAALPESPSESPLELAPPPAGPAALPVSALTLSPLPPQPVVDQTRQDAGTTPLPVSDGATPDASSTRMPTPDADAAEPAEPVVPEACADFHSRTGDSLCLAGDEQCFSLGSVLSPALTAWLDPTTLPLDGSRYWCDRSGQRHHALLLPEERDVVVAADARGVSAALARSFELDSSWLSLAEGSQPALSSGNFAVVVAAAAPLEASDDQAFELFESGEQSRINLTLVPSTGKAEGRITSQETALVTAPVVTRSSVYDGNFHLYSLYRRSEVRVLDDVLQLRLNGVLEFRGSSIAMPRALDLSSPAAPRIGAKTTSSGALLASRGRVAAVVVLRGSVPEDELARLENFFCSALAVCAAPAAPDPAPVTPPLPALADAGP